MSTLSITSINGKRCTAVPRSAAASTQVTSISSSTTPSAAPVAVSTSAAQVVVTTSPVVAVSSTAQQATSQTAAIIASTTPQVISTKASVAQTTTPTVSNTPTVANTPKVVNSPQLATTPAAISSQTSEDASTTTSPAAIVQSEVEGSSTTAIDEVSFTDRISTTLLRSTTSTSAIAQTTSNAAIASAVADATDTGPAMNPGAIAGGVFGGIALVGLLTFLMWWLRRRRNRDSLLTPLNSPPYDVGRKGFYEIDNASVGPTSRGTKFKAHTIHHYDRFREQLSELGISIRTNLARSKTPSINLNRGNSQFMEPISQHSRTSSAFSGSVNSQLTKRDRFLDWWQRLTADAVFNWRLKRKEQDPMEPYAVTRGMSEKTPAVGPDFSNFLAMKDHELRQAAEKRRESLGGFGSLGLDFGNAPMGSNDPFADPKLSQPTVPDLSKSLSRSQGPPQGSGGQVLTLNPFADPTSAPPTYERQSRPVISKPIPAAIGAQTSAYPSDFLPTIRESSRSIEERERVPASRYASTIRVSQDSYRSTFMSTLSGLDSRAKKGRSDPFDLEQMELWRSKEVEPEVPTITAGQAKQVTPTPMLGKSTVGSMRVVSQAQQGPTAGLLDSLAAFESKRASLRKSSSGKGLNAGLNSKSGPSGNSKDSGNAIGDEVQRPRQVSLLPSRSSDAGSYTSKYSSGVSEWGDPGPDLGPFGLRALDDDSIRGNASSMGRSGSMSSARSGDSGKSGKSNGVGKAM